jgi:hypothetical protein
VNATGRDRSARRESSVKEAPSVTESSMTTAGTVLPLSHVFCLRPKAGGSLMTFREGGSVTVRVTFSAMQQALPPQAGFKFPRVVFDEAACNMASKKGRERDIVPLLGIPLADVGASPVDFKELLVDGKRVGVSASGTIPNTAFVAMNVPTSTPGGAGAPGSAMLGQTATTFNNTSSSSSALAANVVTNHNLLVAIPAAPNGASRTNTTLKTLAGFGLDFSDVTLPAGVSVACTLTLKDAATGMADTTTAVIIKETVGADKPPRGRARAALGNAAAVASGMAPRRTAVTPNQPLRGRPASTGSNSDRKSTPNSRPDSSNAPKREGSAKAAAENSKSNRDSGTSTPRQDPSDSTDVANADGTRPPSASSNQSSGKAGATKETEQD